MNNSKALSGIPPHRPSGDQGYLSFRKGDFIIHCCRDGSYNLRESIRQVAAIRQKLSKDVDSVIYVNTPFNGKQLTREFRQHYPQAQKDPILSVLIVPTGDLYQYKQSIMSAIQGKKHAVLMINSWEFSSRGSRQRDELVYFLNILRINYEVTVLIYSHSSGQGAHPGWYHKGGLGKLSLMAEKIYSIGKESEDEAEQGEVTPAEPKPSEYKPAVPVSAAPSASNVITPTLEKERAPREGVNDVGESVGVVRAQASSSNVNELEGQVLKRRAEAA